MKGWPGTWLRQVSALGSRLGQTGARGRLGADPNIIGRSGNKQNEAAPEETPTTWKESLKFGRVIMPVMGGAYLNKVQLVKLCPDWMHGSSAAEGPITDNLTDHIDREG